MICPRDRGSADQLMEAAFPFFSRSDFQDQPSSRAYRHYKAFEAVLDRILGDRVREDGACGVDLWCALANIRWRSPDGEVASYGFRRAGEVVAWVREEGDYLTWYCSGEPGHVAAWIEGALAGAGWSWSRLEPDAARTGNVPDDSQRLA